MLRNYLKTAFRNLFKNRLFTVINIAGLSLGIAVAILILLFVRNEMAYDHWLPDSDRIYRVWRTSFGHKGTVFTPDPLAETLVENFPEVEQAAALSPAGETLLDFENERLYVEDIAVVDSTFFNIAQLPFLHGNRKEALKKPDAIVLSKRIANIFFGEVNPIGKSIRLNGETDFTVAGVLADLPENTHFDYEVYYRYRYRSTTGWIGNSRATYALLAPTADVAALEVKMTELALGIIERELIADGREMTSSLKRDWKLQPFSEIHLHSQDLNWWDPSGGNIKYVYIFSLIAIIVLIIASINYVNLSTARSVSRAKEVGIRKVVGGHRSQLMFQFLTEASLQTVIALIIGVGLAESFLPWFNQITDRDLSFLQGNWLPMILPLLSLGILVSLMAGSYPAFLLSSFEPMRVIKGQVAKGDQKQTFRKAFVVFQFATSIILIIVMTFIYRQVNFMLNQDLGFNSDQVVVIPFNLNETGENVHRLRDQFLSIPGVEQMTVASQVPGGPLVDWILDIENDPEERVPDVLFTDFDFAETLDLEMEQGRYFSPQYPTDTLSAFVVNEAFVDQFGLQNPVGTRCKFSWAEEFGQIVGVVKNFHYLDLQREIKPVIIGMRFNYSEVAIRVASDNITTTISDIRKLWSNIEPQHPMRYSFLDEDFAAQYSEHQRLGQTLLYGTILAIFIAILGLFGLATYSAARRTKEIGIRKVLGASIQGLTIMLVKDFVKWILVAGSIAVPLGYFLTKRWLRDFAYQTEISAWPFLVAIFSALVIAVLTVSFQAIRATTANPVEALKDE